MAKLKLFCIPYAGGSAMIYAKWKNYLHSSIDIYPVKMAGRSKRDSIPLKNNFDEVVDDLYESIKDKIEFPYAIFGHSMGLVSL
jgi:medium-chain acyl-[acyl-carrier-protein] hydrolase